VPAVLRAQLKLGESPAGVVIEAVEAGSLALAAGLREFDVVLRIDGAGVSGEDDLAALLEPGEHKVAILREGERRELAFAGPAAEAPEPKAAPAPKAEAPPAAPPAKAAPEATPAPAPAPEKGDGGLRRY
jgi:predicted metalloprotease with PDZ domain